MSAAGPHPHGFSLRDSAIASPYARAEGSSRPFSLRATSRSFLGIVLE